MFAGQWFFDGGLDSIVEIIVHNCGVCIHKSENKPSDGDGEWMGSDYCSQSPEILVSLRMISCLSKSFKYIVNSVLKVKPINSNGV